MSQSQSTHYLPDGLSQLLLGAAQVHHMEQRYAYQSMPDRPFSGPVEKTKQPGMTDTNKLVDFRFDCCPRTTDAALPISKEFQTRLYEEKCNYLVSGKGTASDFLQQVLEALDITVVLGPGKQTGAFRDVHSKTSSGKFKRRGGTRLLSARQVQIHFGGGRSSRRNSFSEEKDATHLSPPDTPPMRVLAPTALPPTVTLPEARCQPLRIEQLLS